MAKKSKSPAGGGDWLSVAGSEAARAGLRRWRSWGTLIGWLLALSLLWKSYPPADALLRSFGGALTGYLVSWWAAGVWWRQTLRAQARQALQRQLQARAQAAQQEQEAADQEQSLQQG